MNIQLDDPRLTAYALNELEGSEREKFEALLKDDQEAREEVENIRAAAQLIADQFAREPEESLSQEQRENIMAASSKERVAHFPRRWVSGLVAAGICILVGATIWNKNHQGNIIEEQNNLTNIAKLQMDKTNAIKAPASASAAPAVVPVPVPAPASAVPASAAVPAPPPPPIANEELSIKSSAVSVNVPAAPEQVANGGENAPIPKSPTLNNEHTHSILEYGARLPPGGEGDGGNNSPGASPKGNSNGARAYAQTADQLKALGYCDQNEATNMKDINGASVDADCLIYKRKPADASMRRAPGTESYDAITENQFQLVSKEPLSTFSIDVDTASYSNVRRFLTDGTLPPKNAVRIEELINYFDYSYPQPKGDSPFSVNVDMSECPWNADHSLVRIGLKGKSPVENERPACNLVFLLDVSGSMADENKLPLLKKSMKLFTNALKSEDRIGLVTYSTTAKVVLESVAGNRKNEICSVFDSLSTTGSTNCGDGILVAYDMAKRHFIPGGINRVLLATDGDFNTGLTEKSEFEDLITNSAKSGVFLSVLGFGVGNLKDSNLEALADKGNGHYAYVDSFNEARKVLAEQASQTLMTIAKDVKIQVEFNPAKVGAYRLIGYENRVMAAKDFNDDRKDAGEIGAGHTVTALYELVAPGKPVSSPSVDPLKYQTNQPSPPAPETSNSSELMTVKLRYKNPESDQSARLDIPIPATEAGEISDDFRFASSVAMFGMLLRDSEFKGTASFEKAIDIAQKSKGADPSGNRAEFINLLKTADALMK
jgi:Ca-activated chloride channel family protein